MMSLHRRARLAPMLMAVAPCLAALLTSCATPHTGIEPATSAPTQLSTTGESTRQVAYNPDNSLENRQFVHTRIDRAWIVLPEVFRGFALDVVKSDEPAHTLEGRRVRARGMFAGSQFSNFIDCGETALIPNANRFEITLQVRTILKAAGDSTLVSTLVVAQARSGEFGGGDVPCTPNTEIAKRIAKAVADATK